MGVDINQIATLVQKYYNEGEWFDASEKQKLKTLMGSLFDEMDYGKTENGKTIQGKDGKISIKEDGITDEYAKLFGLTNENSLTKDEFLGKIDAVVKALGENEKAFPTQYRKADFKLKEVKILTPQEAYTDGQDTFKRMKGAKTNYLDYKAINIYLENLTPENVVEFLKGFNAAKNDKLCRKNEGIMEMMDDEWDDGRLKMENKKHLVETLLKVAEAKGLTNSPNYTTITGIMEEYGKGGEFANATDFNHNQSWTPKTLGSIASGGAAAGGAAAGLGAIFGSNPIGLVTGLVTLAGAGIAAACDLETDNERLDQAMNALLEEIQNKR